VAKSPVKSHPAQQNKLGSLLKNYFGFSLFVKIILLPFILAYLETIWQIKP
jgi:hypothetical protein